MSTPEQFMNCPGGTVYTVRPGDTLFAIAQRFNTTVQAIVNANPGLDPNLIYVGQQICIPVPAPPCPGFIYTVQAGDTLFAIAMRYNTTVQAIVNVNPGLDPNIIFVGQRICIPTAPTPTCPGFFYTIQAGDTFFSLAQRFGTTVQAIQAANPGVDPNRLQIGQRICIPVQQPQPPTCPGFFYTIQAGDTFFTLAQRYGTTVQAIQAANPGVDPNRLQIGQRICIPVQQPQPPTCPGFFYTIQAGDTFFSLAQRYRTTVQAIQAANPGVDPTQLQIGQRICIPVPRTTETNEE